MGHTNSAGDLSLTTLTRFLKAAYPDEVAPLVARISKLAKMFDVSDRDVRDCIRRNAIQPMGVGGSGPRYCVLEVWDAVMLTKGKAFPKRGNPGFGGDENANS